MYLNCHIFFHKSSISFVIRIALFQCILYIMFCFKETIVLGNLLWYSYPFLYVVITSEHSLKLRLHIFIFLDTWYCCKQIARCYSGKKEEMITVHIIMLD